MRSTASILHLDLDAFFASVEQRDKPSLRGRPVVVGGLGPRGVVSTASYEARERGVRSAMRMTEARARCPHAAFLAGRFAAYREASGVVMESLRARSPLVEPLSLDEAFVDLAAADGFGAGIGAGATADVAAVVETIRADVTRLTGLTASAGVASSKLLAKIATDLGKPDGVTVVPPGTETALIGPMPVAVIPGVGPATTERLRRSGLVTVADVREMTDDDLQRLLGAAAGSSLYRLCRAQDDREVEPHRETKSISVEDTFPDDVADRERLGRVAERMARSVAERLTGNGLSGRTVTLKVRHHDFTTHTRSSTLPGPTDDPRVIVETVRTLLAGTDLGGGLRLLGVGVSGLADWVQEDLFGGDRATDSVLDSPESGPGTEASPTTGSESRPTWAPGADVHHRLHGDGWVWGAGLGRVTVRFETRFTPPGPVRTVAADDPDLRPGHRDDVSHEG